MGAECSAIGGKSGDLITSRIVWQDVEKMTVANCFFSNCISNNLGGAIAVIESETCYEGLEVRDTTFLSCSGLNYGGAIYSDADKDSANT
jgi:hypothetical protein